MGKLFRALYTGTGPGSCPQGHGPHNQVQDCCGISSETCHIHRVWTTTTTTQAQTGFVTFCFCVANNVRAQRAAHGSYSAAKRAAAALDASARAADRPHGPGSCSPPQCWSVGKGGDAAERRPTGTDDCRQGWGGGGARDTRRPTGTDGFSTGEAARHLAGARAAAKRPHRAALRRGRPPDPWLVPVLAGALGEAVDTSALRFLAAAALEDLRKLEEEAKVKGEGEGGGEAEEAGQGEGEVCCERGEDAEAERSCPAGPAAHSGRMGGMVSLERHQAQHLLVLL